MWRNVGRLFPAQTRAFHAAAFQPQFAVFTTGGKQYKVSEGAMVVTEKLPGDPGSQLTFQEVLLVGDAEHTLIGKPTVSGATVTAEIEEQRRQDKVLVFKKKRRKQYRRQASQAQEITILRVQSIGMEEAA